MKHRPVLVMKAGVAELKRIVMTALRFGGDDYAAAEGVLFWTVVVLLVLSLGASAAWEIAHW